MHIVKENLKQMRKNKKLTQLQVANEIGVTRQCYALYEQGRRQPSIDILRKICDFFNCMADEIIN